MEKQQKPTGTITARARLGVDKVHNENSPDVIAGIRELGEVEHIEGETKLIEVDFDKAVSMWGEETAIGLFNKRDAEAQHGN